VVHIRLTKRLAAMLNSIDVSALREGDIVDVPDKTAQMLVSDGWAEPITGSVGPPIFGTGRPRFGKAVDR
jgi:hypothetical protein